MGQLLLSRITLAGLDDGGSTGYCVAVVLWRDRPPADIAVAAQGGTIMIDVHNAAVKCRQRLRVSVCVLV